MALTKVTGQVIKNTTDVTVGVLTVTNTLSVGGTVSIGGTLTYEDVTNIDSVGLITARNGIVVGSGITLSKDGDIFATGVTTTGSLVSSGAISGTTGTFSGATSIDGTLTVSSVDAGATGPILKLFHNSASPADNDVISLVKFSGDDDAGNETEYASIRSTATDVSNGSESGDITFHTINSGSFATRLRLDPSGRLLKSGQASLTSTSLNHPIQVAAASDATTIAIIGRASDDISEISFYEADKSTNLGELQYRQDHLNLRHRVGEIRFASGGVTDRLAIETAGNVKVNKNISVTGIATVGSAVTISESGIEASGIGITCANINGSQIGGRRNLVINGAMMVAQRGTSSTSDGYHTVDRFAMKYGGEDEAPTQAQVDVSSGTTPYTEGFRQAFKITNGNQTGGADHTDYLYISYKFEARDLAQSGWNYVSASSFVTLSFWVKSSVAQTFYGYLKTTDGTAQNFRFETGSLSANTWKKVVVKVPGAANITFDDNFNEGLELVIAPWFGSSYTAQSGDTPLGSWAAFASGTRMRDMTSTWYTTNDATFEITGVQLEVGSQATPFEWRSFHEERQLCYRYYFRQQPNNGAYFGQGFVYNAAANGGANAQINGLIHMPVRLRSKPSSVETSGTASHYRVIANATTLICTSVPSHGGDLDDLVIGVNFHTAASNNSNGDGRLFRSASSSAFLGFDAEL